MKCTIGPPLGSIVHYVLKDENGIERPAILIQYYAVEEGIADLAQFTHPVEDQTGSPLKFRTAVPYSEEPKPGSWHYPTKE